MPRKPKLPPNLERRPDRTNIQARFMLNNKVTYRSTGTTDVAKALKKLDEFVEEAWEEHLTSRERITFGEAFDRVYPIRWRDGPKAKWHRDIKRSVLTTAGGDFYLDDVTEEWCLEFIDRRRAGGSRINTVNPKPVSNTTINQELAFIKRVMMTVDEAKFTLPVKRQMMNKRGIYSGAPTFPIPRIAQTRAETEMNNVLKDEDEAMALVDEMVPHARPVLLTMLLTGLRRENVMNLDIRKNIHWNERIIEVKQKGGEKHEVPIGDELYYLLRETCGDRVSGPVFIFGINGCTCQNCNPVNKKTGKPNASRRQGRIKSIRTTFYTARERIGRPEVRIHDMRHTLGTWLNRRGSNLNTIRELLGHKDIVTTQRYLHVDTDAGREQIDNKISFKLREAG
ncbi:MAG: site-specific integrase [Pseudomonadota bacterium]|nr:site-specific integrase [Pseudomonadota bacterium]